MEQPSAGEDAPKTPVDRERDAPFVILDPPQQAAPELVCPNCDYSLAGLTEDRCPECGQTFDRAELIRWHTEPDLPLPLGRSGPLPFPERILYLSIFAPTRLSRGLPPLANEVASRDFARGMRCMTGAASCLIAIMGSAGSDPVPGLAVGLGLAGASIACEAVVAWMLTALVQPRAVRADRRHAFWRTLCRCFAGHLLLTIGGIAACAFLAAVAGSVVPLGLPILTMLYWSFCLGLAVRARGLESPGRTLAILLIPVCGAGAICLFVAALVLIGLML